MTADRAPDPARFEAGVRIVLGRIAPHLAALPLRRQSTLPASLVYAVGPDHFLRMALAQDLALNLLREARLLERLRGVLPVAIPAVVAVSERPAAVVLRRLPGVAPFHLDIMPAAARDRLAGDVAHFLAALHGLPTAGFGRSDPLSVARQHALLATAFAQVAATLAPATRRYIEGALAELGTLPEVETAVIHGDLHVDNMLIEPGSGALTGIIDFGLCGRGDPHVDLVRLARRSASFVEDLAARYRARGGHALDAERLRVLCRATISRQVALGRDPPAMLAMAEAQMAAGAFTRAGKA